MAKIIKNPIPEPTREELEMWNAELTQVLNKAPALTEISVSIKATIPLLQYGNIEMFVSQKFTVHDTVEAREDATIMGLNQLKRHVAEVVLPLAEAEIERGLPALLREANPDTWMQKQNSVYRWLRVAQPDLVIPAMEAVIMNEDRINLVMGNHKG